jgi:hypothetical protein
MSQGNGHDAGDETIRVYIELKNMAEVRAVLAFAESMDLVMRMAPMIRGKMRGTRGPTSPSAADSYPIEKHDLFKLGPPGFNLPADSEAKERFPIVAKILQSDALEYQEIVRQFGRKARIDKRRAGFTISFLIRMGALVRQEQQ